MKNLGFFVLLFTLTGCLESKFGTARIVSDITDPSEVTAVYPPTMSYINSVTDVLVEGQCEDGATILFSGADLAATSPTETDCSGGFFSVELDFDTSLSTYGGKEFNITQVDAAGNESDPELFNYEYLEFVPMSISAGGEHTCAFVTGHGVRCWGAGTEGQLGNNTTSDASEPVVVTYATSTSASFVSQAALDLGSDHACTFDQLGNIYCWGNQLDGRLGNGSTTAQAIPGATAASSVPSTVTDISAGGAHTCAVTAAGGVICTGNNSDGQIGGAIGVVTESSVFVDMSYESSSLASISAVTAGDKHTCALRGGQYVLCWGDNDTGALGDGTTTDSNEPVFAQVSSSAIVEQIQDVQAGNGFTCALQNSSAGNGVQCWGANDLGQLGNGTASPTPSLEAQDVVGLADIQEIAVGARHACAITIDDTVVCWGDNSAGQLGVNDALIGSSDTPLEVPDLTRVVSIAAGDEHTCALTDFGSLFCWGANLKGQLGDSSNTDRTVPTLVYLSP